MPSTKSDLRLDVPVPVDDQDIAIVGMAGRFPGARNLDEFWNNLAAGMESIRPVSVADLRTRGVDPALLRDPHHVKVAAVLDGMDLFDAAFFGFNPREAELMDPQHRVFLECCWEALERAGHAPETFPGAIGVFGGATTNTYLVFNLVSNPELLSTLDQVQIDVGNGADFLSTRVAYKLNLHGPGYTVQSACSTSLVATHVACQSLLAEECDLALAGGVSIHVKHPEGYRYLPGGIVSPDGHCRAFDARAEGTVFGSGVGVVALRRLKDALADGNHIHAIIKGSAINNDGSVKVGYTAPSVEGQAAVIGEALGAAGVEPETIGYVETHGTGTKLGDPIEIRALTKAFGFRPGQDAAGRCPIGSVKTNIGHLAGAAGIASLIKAVLALEHRQIPPTLHFTAPNPEIDFARSPFYVNAALAEWAAPAGVPRRVGVSSFGVGGTNAHVVLEEAPAQGVTGASESSRSSRVARPVQLLLLSAKTNTALEAATAQLGRHLEAHPELALADVAYTLQVGRQAMAHRRVLVCRDCAEAVAALASGEVQRLWTETPSVTERPVAFLFPGQGAQHVNMGRELYETELVFREQLDACAESLRQQLPGGLDLRTLLYPAPAEAEAAMQRLGQTGFTQPALFAIEYALAQMWMSWGVRPSAMIGHSIGEYVAACLAGVFSMGDALALVAARGQLMQSLPAGAMLAVFLGPGEIEPRLGPDLSVAAINAPRLTVVAGPMEAVEALEARLQTEGVGCQRLHTSHAFHSAMMDPIVAPFTERVRAVKLQPPRIPYVSNVTGRWIEAAQATDPGYWAMHLRQAVRFSAGLETLREHPQQVLLEVGPGQTLGTLARQRVDQAAPVVLSSMRHVREQTSDLAMLVGTLGKLWLNGVGVDWSAYHAKERRRRVPLPSYPFERKRYWIEARPFGSMAGSPAGTASASAASSPSPMEKKPDVADWFYVPSWRRLPPARPTDLQLIGAEKRGWLVFADECGLGPALVQRLGPAGQTVTQVVRGTGFARWPDGTYAIDPRQREDYEKLFQALAAQGVWPDVIVHLWSVLPGPVSLEQALDVGFYSLLYLAQALSLSDRSGRKEPLALWVAANDVHKVESTDTPWPEKATLLGPCRVISQEVPRVTCRFVDVALGSDGSAARAAGPLLGEIRSPAEETVVALRGTQRWVPRFEPLRLAGDRPPARTLRERGVYLIVDGLTGIGRVWAEALARSHQARLILVEGADISAAHDAEDPVSRTLRQVQALEAAGAEVLVVRAEPTKEDEMRRAVAAGRERFGRIDGVFYAAGGMQGATLRTLQETGPADCAWHFAHQVHGLQVLAQVLPAEGLDFCCLASSLSTLLGGLGQVAHAAASHFMDAFAEHRNERGSVDWISVDWDVWQFPKEDGRPVAALSAALAPFAILPAEGSEATRRLLTQAPAGQIVVSTGDLGARRRHWEEVYRSQNRGQGQQRGEAARAGHARPALGTPYLAPRGELEQAITTVWQQVLGIAEVGVNDNFFELGGHSLLATQLRNHLYEAVRVDLPLRDLFEKPTVAGVAELIEKRRAQQATAQEKPIRERLRVAFPTEKQALLEEYLHKKIAAGLRLAVEELPREGSLRGFDLHLLGAELEYDLRQNFKFQLFPHEVQEHPSIPSLAGYLLAEMDRLADPTRFLTDRPLSDYRLRPYRKHTTVAEGGSPTAQGKNPSMVFVHSSPRAGSTLFRVMLAGHPQLFCPPEVNLLFFDNLQEWRQNIGFGHEMEWTTGGLQWAFMELLGIDSAAGQALIDKMLADNVSAKHVYGRLQELCQPRLLVDKTPSYSLDLDTLWRAEAMFDRPRYIYLYRHPYPVMESILRVRFDRLFGPSLFGEVEVDPYVVAETVWALSNRNLLTFFERIGRERCLWVRYEELVAEPEKVMAGVCAFLGIPFDERVLAPYDGKRERMMGGLGDPNLLQHNRIESDLGEAWRRIKWPRALEPSTREVVVRLGYEVPKAQPRREVSSSTASTASTANTAGMAGTAQAEELLANLDQLSDEQVAALLAEMSGNDEA